jgi:hypothetical protein
MRNPRLRSRGVTLACAGLALAVAGRLAGEVPSLGEWHRAFVLPQVAAIQQLASGSLVSTMGEPLAVVAVVFAVAALIKWRRRAVGAVIFGTGFLVFLFYVAWGTAYDYPPLASRLAPVPAPSDTGELVRRTEQTARFIALAAAGLPPVRQLKGEDVLARSNAALTQGFAALPSGIEAAPVHEQVFGPAKISRVSWALSRLQLSGYYFPWTGEAQINGDMPLSLWPRVAAHEKAHQRGFARENEATVVGLLACLASADPFVRYAAGLGLFAAFDRDLARVDPEARGAIWESLPARATDDLRAEVAFWKRFDGPAAVVSERVNDTYLKTQGVRSGVASYGETTRLLLQAMETPGLPLRARLDGETLR